VLRVILSAAVNFLSRSIDLLLFVKGSLRKCILVWF